MGAPTLEFGGKTIIWQDFCRKLHENEINETEMDPAIKSEISVSWQIKDFVITARKQSLRRLCFYTCLSVHRGEYLGRYPPGRYTPQARTPTPLGRYSLAGTPLGRYPPGRYTLPGQYTSWAGPPPGRYTPQAGVFLFHLR